MTLPNKQMHACRCMTCGHQLNIQRMKSGHIPRTIRYHGKNQWECVFCAKDYSYRETFALTDTVNFDMEEYVRYWGLGIFRRENHQGYLFVGNTYYYAHQVEHLLDDLEQAVIDELVHTGIHEFLHYIFEWFEYLSEPYCIEEDIISNIMSHWKIHSYWYDLTIYSYLLLYG